MNGYLRPAEKVSGFPFMIGGMLTDYLRTFGKRARLLRQDLHITQKGLAKLLEEHGVFVQNTWVSELEGSEENRFPSVDVVVAFAKALGTTTDFLLMLSDDPLPPKNQHQATHLSDEAEEAARIIDDMPPKWRERVIDVVRRTNEDYAEHSRQNEAIFTLLESIEKKLGPEAKIELMRRLGL